MCDDATFQTNLECHSQAVGHGKDETVCQKTFHGTHILVDMGKAMVKYPLIKCAISLTTYRSYKGSDDISFRKYATSLTRCWSQERGDEIVFLKVCNATYSLFVIKLTKCNHLAKKCVMSLTFYRS
jgi:hypothetical protein